MSDISDKILEKLAEIQATCSELTANQKNNYNAIQEAGKTLKEQGKTLERLTATVEIHEMRSTSLKEELDLTKKMFDKRISSVNEKLTPVVSHVERVMGAGMLIRWIAYVSGAILSAYGIFKLFK